MDLGSTSSEHATQTNFLLLGGTSFGLQLHRLLLFTTHLGVHETCLMGFLLVHLYRVPPGLTYGSVMFTMATLFPQIPFVSNGVCK